ncbi:MAG TPA: 2-keto-3-deoxygluconate permease [Bacillales bacterium]|nr:2-keto-3-deoxygluconate permease [Bacillales bacterium]
MKIKATLDRIPGGLMIIPLFLAAIINTFAPGLLRIGGFTEALFVNGVMPLIAFFLLCVGAEINVTNARTAVAKGTTMLVVKWVIGAGFGMLSYIFAGPNGLFLGLAPLAVIAAMTNSNGSMYVAIVSQYGKEDDKAAIGILSLNDGPFLTMVALAIFGTMGFVDGFFSFINFVAVILPILIGAILGNLDPEMRDFLTKGANALIPFMAFGLGMTINLGAILEGGLAGIALGVLTVFLTGTTCSMVFKGIGWNPIVGAAEGAVAGNAIATPAVIATVSASFAPIAGIATVQVAAACVTSGILLPIYIAYLVKKQEKNNMKKEVPLNTAETVSN